MPSFTGQAALPQRHQRLPRRSGSSSRARGRGRCRSPRICSSVLPTAISGRFRRTTSSHVPSTNWPAPEWQRSSEFLAFGSPPDSAPIMRSMRPGEIPGARRVACSTWTLSGCVPECPKLIGSERRSSGGAGRRQLGRRSARAGRRGCRSSRATPAGHRSHGGLRVLRRLASNQPSPAFAPASCAPSSAVIFDA